MWFRTNWTSSRDRTDDQQQMRWIDEVEVAGGPPATEKERGQALEYRRLKANPKILRRRELSGSGNATTP